jgi:diguanylate cyclase
MTHSDLPDESELRSPPSQTQEVMEALQEIRAGLPAALMQRVTELATANAEEITGAFYETLWRHDLARPFLHMEEVRSRLTSTMKQWLLMLFGPMEEGCVEAFVARNLQVGKVHARIKLPPHLMQMGTRTLSREFRKAIAASELSREDALAAQIYVTEMLYLADGIMMGSYVRDAKLSVRADETYRHVAMRQDTSLERERQRAYLSEWVNDLLFSSRFNGTPNQVPKLGDSEFGLWLKHKGRVLFDTLPDVRIIYEAMSTIDETVIPGLFGPDTSAAATREHYEELKRQIDFIRYLVGDLFDRLASIDEGRDTLTGLYSRRHLPAVLSREIDEHRRTGAEFGVLLLRINNLDLIAHNEETQRILLQQVAALVIDSAHGGDHVFRYGNSEFLILAVEADGQALESRASGLLRQIKGHRFSGREHAQTRIAASVGAARFDGHPDYMRMLRKAENALTEAAMSGENNLVLYA